MKHVVMRATMGYVSSADPLEAVRARRLELEAAINRAGQARASRLAEAAELQDQILTLAGSAIEHGTPMTTIEKLSGLSRATLHRHLGAVRERRSY